MIYLDYSATTPVEPAVLEVMLPFLREKYGNPSVLYEMGKEPRLAVEGAREIIGKAINALPEEIIFTSSGTESNNYAVIGTAFANKHKGNHIITSQIEHKSVLEPCRFIETQGFKVTYLRVDKYGTVDPEDVRKAIAEDTILVSIMHANNEIGTIQNIAEIGKITKENGIIFHTDAVQSFGHIPVDVEELGVDLVSLSAHKLYGPKGIGALYIRKGIRITPLLYGGHQEQNKRASTENVPGIVGFGKAVELAKRWITEEDGRIKDLRDKFIRKVLESIPDVSLNGHPTERLPNNINFSFKGIIGERLVLLLDKKGIYCSTGSACSTGSTDPSHVLLAIGLSRQKAYSSVRFTLGRMTKEEDVDYVIDILSHLIETLRDEKF